MMDVQELRSFFVTKDVKTGERAVPATSGGEFDETLSCCSQKREPFSKGTSPDEEVPEQPGTDTSDTGKTGEFRDVALCAMFLPSGGTVGALPNDLEGERGVSSSRDIGAKTYHQLLSSGVASQEEVLLGDLRQLKFSAHVFGAKAGQGTDVLDGDSRDALETAERELSATCDHLTGVLLEGILPSIVRSSPVHDGAFSGGGEREALFPEAFDGGTLKEQQGSSAQTPSSPAGDSPKALLQGQEGAFPSPSVWRESGKDLPQEGLFDGNGSSSTGPSARSQGYVAGEGRVLPIDDEASAAGQGSPASVSAERQDLLPDLLTKTGVPLPAKAVQEGKEPVTSGENRFVEENPLADLSRSGPGSGDVLPARPTLADRKESQEGEFPAPLTDQGKTFSTEGPKSIFPERAKEDLSASSSFPVNPMEVTPGKTAGGEVFLEARGVEAMARGLAETIHVVRKGDRHTGTIRVSPPHLGQVNITVESSGDTVQIHLRVESVEVRDMLDQTADVLKQALADKGVSLTGMSVDVGGQGAGESSQGRSFGSDPVLDHSADEVAGSAEDETEEIIARLDLERGMLHWVA